MLDVQCDLRNTTLFYHIGAKPIHHLGNAKNSMQRFEWLDLRPEVSERLCDLLSKLPNQVLALLKSPIERQSKASPIVSNTVNFLLIFQRVY